MLMWVAVQHRHMLRASGGRRTPGDAPASPVSRDSGTSQVPTNSTAPRESLSIPTASHTPESSDQGRVPLAEGREVKPNNSNIKVTPNALVRRSGESLLSFSTRWRSFLPAACRELEATRTPYRTAVRGLTTSPGVFAACVPKKAGFTSWEDLRKQLSRRKPPQRQPTSIITVRHPLGRLVSGYRDKFLGGAPISEYNGTWRRTTGSGESWERRWRDYWLPCLIARGSVALPKHCLPDLKGPYRSNLERQRISACLALNCSRTARETFRNAVFTFRDYIQMVLWSHDHGVMNVHFAPIASLCAPCNRTYDFIVHTETLSQDVNELFAFLGVPPEVQMKQKHTSHSSTRGSSDALFAAIPSESMARILSIYEPDYALFGYA
ncbi:hypothetical protein C7M84_006951 [Penaeus vannamei]|uniref:Carbohydrate sulfotransferase n=1 Tax=Penaeus vannamei TaxID=6689 RepID=A0A423TDJ6_PENVA|nr:hypothetical protein C7M84_006951 [Penaeus vannamei]